MSHVDRTTTEKKGAAKPIVSIEEIVLDKDIPEHQEPSMTEKSMTAIESEILSTSMQKQGTVAVEKKHKETMADVAEEVLAKVVSHEAHLSTATPARPTLLSQRYSSEAFKHWEQSILLARQKRIGINPYGFHSQDQLTLEQGCPQEYVACAPRP